MLLAASFVFLMGGHTDPSAPWLYTPGLATELSSEVTLFFFPFLLIRLSSLLLVVTMGLEMRDKANPGTKSPCSRHMLKCVLNSTAHLAFRRKTDRGKYRRDTTNCDGLLLPPPDVFIFIFNFTLIKCVVYAVRKKRGDLLSSGCWASRSAGWPWGLWHCSSRVDGNQAVQSKVMASSLICHSF